MNTPNEIRAMSYIQQLQAAELYAKFPQGTHNIGPFYVNNNKPKPDYTEYLEQNLRYNNFKQPEVGRLTKATSKLWKDFRGTPKHNFFYTPEFEGFGYFCYIAPTSPTLVDFSSRICGPVGLSGLMPSRVLTNFVSESRSTPLMHIMFYNLMVRGLSKLEGYYIPYSDSVSLTEIQPTDFGITPVEPPKRKLFGTALQNTKPAPVTITEFKYSLGNTQTVPIPQF